MVVFWLMKWAWVCDFILIVMITYAVLVLGKTIQAVSLILQNRPKPQDKSLMQQWKLSDISHGMISENIQHCGTLIVLPTIAIRQWQMEIGRFTKEGSLKVKVYHGSDRNTSIQDLVSHDVIITSYKVSANSRGFV
jgi:SNF2 family DNA or RNA helicase